jgi:hypothetical protein
MTGLATLSVHSLSDQAQRLDRMVPRFVTG